MPDLPILIVDDERAMREGLRDNLEFEGYAVEEAADGEEALAKVLGGTYRLVVLDVMMPGVSGLDAIRAIRADPALADLPVILLTARAQESDVETGFDSGADDYITKPFSPRELASRVEALLSRSG